MEEMQVLVDMSPDERFLVGVEDQEIGGKKHYRLAKRTCWSLDDAFYEIEANIHNYQFLNAELDKTISSDTSTMTIFQLILNIHN